MSERLVLGWGDGHPGPVVHPRSLGAITGAVAVPRSRRQCGGDLVDALRPDGRAGGDAVISGHSQDIPEAAGLQVTAQGAVAAVELVRCAPRGRGTGVQGSGQHPPSQGDLRGEPHRLRHAGSGQPGRIVGPAARQADLPVDQRVPVPGGIRQEHRHREVGRWRGARVAGPFPTPPSRTRRTGFPVTGSPVAIAWMSRWVARYGCGDGRAGRPRGFCVVV